MAVLRSPLTAWLTRLSRNPKKIGGSVGLILLFVIAVLCLPHTTFIQRLHRDEQVLSTTNQACIGLNRAATQGLHVDPIAHQAKTAYYHDPDSRVASFTCNIDKNSRDLTKTESVAQVDSQGYELGAAVTYFSNAGAAENYAEHVMNPLRYWSVDTKGQNEGIPQTSIFTSFIGTTDNLYFDAYSVHDNALVRISLPCDFPESEQGTFTSSRCYGTLVDNSMAATVLQSFAGSIKQLHL